MTNLHKELALHNVYVAHRSLGLMIKEAGTGNYDDPEMIADMWYEAYINREKWEDVYSSDVTATTMTF